MLRQARSALRTDAAKVASPKATLHATIEVYILAQSDLMMFYRSSLIAAAGHLRRISARRWIFAWPTIQRLIVPRRHYAKR
ncbi:MAG TPA: hypothetical protein VGO01_12485 [Bradyrhizobium sp.]|jgi:hypothetical protein|nr:hypothetical protein [Bradyrhizobium sp.]